MNSQQMMEEIDRLARLCEAKDAEIKELMHRVNNAEDAFIQCEDKLSEAQAQIAMQAEAIQNADDELCESQAVENNYVGTLTKRKIVEARKVLSRAISSTSETVAAWRAKETEPYKREVAMLRELLTDSWAEEYNNGVELRERLRNALADTQTTALAYEQEVENRGAVRALEEALKSDEDFSFLRNHIRQRISELRASKGE